MSQEDLAFLQRRVSIFGLAVAILGGFFLVLRTIIGVSLQVWDEFNFTFAMHALAVSSFGAIWLLCRGRERSLRFVRMTESIGLVCGCLIYEGMGYFMPLVANPMIVVVLALTAGFVARSVYVPSTPRRTLLLCAVVAVPLAVISYFKGLQMDPAVWAALVGPWDIVATSEGYARINVVLSLAWWTVTTAICTATSRVIYGLRREVQSIRKLGQYTLEEKLGEGGMGVVYRASHAMLRRPTAIKLLPPDKSGAGSLARFEREVQLTAGLTHPNTVTVFDYGRTPDGLFYYVMELLDGASLDEIVEASGPQPPARVVQILDDAAGALAEAHAVGLIHRDIKPANIVLCERGGVPDVAKVVDFGLVKELSSEVATSLTGANVLTGTPQYMSPEAIRAPDEVDARSDLYALGAVGYFLLTGQHVFSGATMVEICSHHLHSEPIPPSERVDTPIPGALERVILSCLAKDKADRPASATALQEALRACDGVDDWSQHDARRWWDEHGGAIASRRRGGQPLTDASIAIDLARTMAASAP